METVANIVHAAKNRLQRVTETPALDAEILLSHSLGLTRAQLLARLNEPVDPNGFEALLTRRAHAEPIAHILGEWEFYGLTFATPAPVLVPRPETEHVVEAVLQYLQSSRQTSPRIMDVGTGTGCIAVAVLAHAPQARALVTDIRTKNLTLALCNATRHGVNRRMDCLAADLFAAIRPEPAWDVIACNPPYVAETDADALPETVRRYEDAAALFAGRDGLDAIRKLVHAATRHLKPGGLLAFEMGMRQDGDVLALLAQNAYRDIAVIPDLAGVPRVATGRRSHD